MDKDHIAGAAKETKGAWLEGRAEEVVAKEMTTAASRLPS
jgi:hypothetical protein